MKIHGGNMIIRNTWQKHDYKKHMAETLDRHDRNFRKKR